MTDREAPRVAGYDVTGLLGAGSGGEVWLGRDRGTGEQVALKRVRPGAGLAARDRLRREAAALAGLTHPHVLRLRSVVGCLDAPDDLVLVLDAAPGGSLARLVARQGPRPPGQVVTVLVAVAGALAALHRAGLTHGDVTPSNVLLADDGRPVLGDLGSARFGTVSALDGGATRDERVATPGFADPAGVTGPAADVHGLAATCFFLLTGRPPYDDAGAALPLGLEAVTDAATRRLRTVLDTALDADPRRRPDAAGLARAGFDAARPEPLTFDDLLDDLLDDVPGAAGGATEAAPAGCGNGTSGATAWEVPITQLSRSRWLPASPAGPVSEQPHLVEAPTSTTGRRRGAHARPRAERRGGPGGSRSWSALGRRGLAALATAVAVALAAVTGIAWAGAGPAASPGQAVGVRASASGHSSGVPTGTPGAGASSVSSPGRVASTGPPGSAAPGAARPTRGGRSEVRTGRLTPARTWSARLRALDLARSAAFAAGDVGALDRVYAAGSPALRRDRRALRDLANEGVRAAGVRLRAVHVEVVSSTAGRVRLSVTDELAAYRLLDSRTGQLVERRAGRGPARWLLTLTRQPDGWRVWDVVRR